MEAFKKLIEVSDRLNDLKTGCPWDIKQTFSSLQKYILEEACELIDAIDREDLGEMVEELGDVLYVVIFYCKVAEREGAFTLEKVLDLLREKLVRRHPHVFGEVQCSSSEEVGALWEKIKQKEKSQRTSAMEGIPKSLTALARAQKILSKLIERECEEIALVAIQEINEEALGDQMIELVLRAEHHGIDAEKALRKALTKYESVLSTFK